MNNNELINQFKEISGLDDDQSKFYFEMSGNNLETAISMFFEQSAFSNQNAQPEEDGNINAILTHNVRPDWFNLVWPKNVQAIPESWINQKLEFSDEIKYGLVQHKNGPCGILSVIQAVMI